MRIDLSLSRAVLPAGETSRVDVLASFTADPDTTPRQPISIGLVLDRSGSMGGRPLAHAIKAAQLLVDRLQDDDRVAVVAYDDSITVPVPPRAASDRDAIKRAIAGIRAGGLTNLSGGWLRGCELVGGKDAGLLQRVLVLTDGQANCGETSSSKLQQIAREQAAKGVVTTTLGFGQHFNEDLLIDIADAAGGNFYFIQSPADAAEVFGVEVDGLTSVAALELTAQIVPAAGVSVAEILTNAPPKQLGGGVVELTLGEVYAVEPRTLSFTLETDGSASGEVELGVLKSRFILVTEDGTTTHTIDTPLRVQVGSRAEFEAAPVEYEVVEQANILRIGRHKEEAAKLADRGDHAAAAAHLKQLASRLDQADARSFAFAEELEQLRYFIDLFQKGQYSTVARKELKDQSYQARNRNRADLLQRGASSGSTTGLDAVVAAEGEEPGVVVRCVKQGGKLRVHAISDGYDDALNVQFPRAIRRDGALYVVESLELAQNGGFYRAVGAIKLLLRPGQTRDDAQSSGGGASRNSAALRKSTATTLADLQETTEVGDGILIQIVKAGSKLRARVVSDGYDPDKNMRFPRGVRQEGYLFVVDEVRPSADGSYYIPYGPIRYLKQTTV